MAIDSQVYKELRIVPVRFERATTGDPDIAMPDLDGRGHNARAPAVNGLGASPQLRGPVVELVQEQKIRLRLVRELIDPAAPLYLVSSNESVVTVETPAKGTAVPDGAATEIEIKGRAFTGATPKSAEIQVRFQSESGPIIYALSVYVFGARSVAPSIP